MGLNVLEILKCIEMKCRRNFRALRARSFGCARFLSSPHSFYNNSPSLLFLFLLLFFSFSPFPSFSFLFSLFPSSKFVFFDRCPALQPPKSRFSPANGHFIFRPLRGRETLIFFKNFWYSMVLLVPASASTVKVPGNLFALPKN